MGYRVTSEMVLGVGSTPTFSVIASQSVRKGNLYASQNNGRGSDCDCIRGFTGRPKQTEFQRNVEAECIQERFRSSARSRQPNQCNRAQRPGSQGERECGRPAG